MVLLSVYTTEPNTSHQNHQLSLKKRNIYHRYLFRTDILLHLYERSQRHSLCTAARPPQEKIGERAAVHRLTKTTRPTANKEPRQEFISTAVLPYIKGVSKSLHRCLQQQGVRTVFKSVTTLRSHLVRQKDTLEPTKQDGVVYKIPCECGKVYIGETGRAMQDRIKEHDRDIRLYTSAVSEHANETGHLPIWKEVKFIDRDPHWYTRGSKRLSI